MTKMKSIVVEGVPPEYRDDLLEIVLQEGNSDWTVRDDMVIFVNDGYDESDLADAIMDSVEMAHLAEGGELEGEDVGRMMSLRDIAFRLWHRNGAFGGQHNPYRKDWEIEDKYNER